MQVGPYRVVGEIARGGMGVVYRAQGADGRDVALKLVLAQKAADPRARKRFQLEVQALARLHHPNVVSILEAGEHEGCPWLALEFVEGESLEERLRQGPLPVWEALRIVQQLAQALSYVHSCGLLHRDLKPGNVLLEGSQALLTDFGLVLDDQSSVSRITATGIFQGTPGYWAPEQARGEVGQFGPTTDVYGLGAVLYACLTGRAPVEGGSLQDYLQTVKFRKILAPRRVRPEVPEWLSDLCMGCLALVPTARPVSADEVARALVLAGGGGAGEERTRSRPVALAVAGILGLAGLATIGGGALSSRTGSSEAVASGEELRIEAILDAARSHFNAKRHEEALESFDRALELDPGRPGTHLVRGLCNAALGRHVEAIADCDRALGANPRFAIAYETRGDSNLALGRYAEAVEDYDAAIGLDPNGSSAWKARGDAKQKLGQLAEAVDDYDRALEFTPNYSGALKMRGDAKRRLGLHAEAIDDYDAGLAVSPRSPLALAGRGVSKLKLQRYAEAITDFDRALGLGNMPPTSAATVRELRAEAGAKLAGKTDSPPVSAKGRERARALVESALRQADAGRLHEAIEQCSRAIELDPGNAEAYFGRGVSYSNLGRNSEALADFDRALRLEPGNASIYARRGLINANLGRMLEAIEDYDRALQLDPRNARAYSNRGTSKASLSRFAEAIEDFDRALELGLAQAEAEQVRQQRTEAASGLSEQSADPASAERRKRSRALRASGNAKIQAGRFVEAIEDFDRSLDLEPKSSVYASRGVCKERLGRFVEAIEDYDRAVELDPQNGLAFSARGRGKTLVGAYAEAIEDFDRALELGLDQLTASRVKQARAEATAKLKR